MLSNSNLISCNFSSSLPQLPKTLSTRIPFLLVSNSSKVHHQISLYRTSNYSRSLKPYNLTLSPTFSSCRRHGFLPIHRSSLNSRNSDGTLSKENSSVENNEIGSGNGGNGGNWTTSILLFGLWAALMYYIFMLAPNQTPSRDMYFLEKLLNLRGDDGFQMNEVLVCLWYIMGLWPLVYSMLLLPTGRSSRSQIPVWPFLVLSCFGGAYVLLPYFVLWRPPAPHVEERELRRWPLNFLESKLTSGILFASGLGLIIYAGLANGNVWREFYQYFRESKFIHATFLDFTLLSTFAPFWVYNDMTARKWSGKGSWLLPLALVPFLGPALYLVLRPPISAVPDVLVSPTSTTAEED